MTNDVNGKFDDYLISAKISQILLHWGYELVKSDLLWFFLTVFVHIKMSYYWFNRQELLQKAKSRYHNNSGEEKAPEYYIAKTSIKTCQKKKKK